MSNGQKGGIFVCIKDHFYHSECGTKTVLIPEGSMHFFRDSNPCHPIESLFAEIGSYTGNDSVLAKAFPKEHWPQMGPEGLDTI